MKIIKILKSFIGFILQIVIDLLGFIFILVFVALFLGAIYQIVVGFASGSLYKILGGLVVTVFSAPMAYMLLDEIKHYPDNLRERIDSVRKNLQNK